MSAGSESSPKVRVPAGKLDRAPWFDIEHYRDIPQWSRADWYRAIATRLAVQMGLGHERFWNDIASECIQPAGLSFRPVSILDGVGSRPHEFGSVASVSELNQETLRIVQECLEYPDFRLTAIDMSAADIEIKKDFAEWLRAQRSQGIARRAAMTDDDLKNWTDCRVIPYIDIHLFSKVTKTRFRPVDIQNALFGSTFAIENKGRTPKQILEQSTELYAKRLLSSGYMHRIATMFRDLPRL